MTDAGSERTLAALLGREPDASPPSQGDADGAAARALPTLDARVGMFLRATLDRSPSALDRHLARERILDAMAEELGRDQYRQGEVRDEMPRAEAGRVPFMRRRPAAGPRHAGAAARRRSLVEMGWLAANLAALLVIGWSGVWGYARHSFGVSLAAWREWESKSGRHYACASERYGGAPFRVELLCTDPKATVVTEAAEYHIETKAIRISASLLRPDVIATEIEGPAAIAELGKPDTFTLGWSRAETTIEGRTLVPEGVSIELADLTLEHVGDDDEQPVAKAERVAFAARLDPIATAAAKKSVYDLTSDISAATLVDGPPIASKPFAASMKAVLHGAGDMVPRTLPARIKGWQKRGGFVDITSFELSGSGIEATAHGRIQLSAEGGLDGTLDLSGGDHDRLLAALTREAPAIPPPSPDTMASSPGGTEPAIRFVDGTATLGKVSLGRLPPLF